MKVFLTGGTGFIGQAVVRRIRARGWVLKVLVRNPDSAPARWIARQGGELVAGDVTAKQGLTDALAGADVLIHNAGVYEIGADAATIARMHAVNVEGSRIILEVAAAAKISRTIYVSSIVALGATGWPPAPSIPRDETFELEARCLTPYETTKTEGHRIALEFRARGLPLTIAMPNAVAGANDHSAIGHTLRLVLLGAMPPVAWGGDVIFALVDVDALAEGFCLAAEKAAMGEDYLFCGDSAKMRDVFAAWGRISGKMTPRWFLPYDLMRPSMALMEPLLRALGVPAFLSRDSVDTQRGHFNYTSAKARRDLGWTHPAFADMWPSIIAREQALMAKRSGFLAKLRHQPVVED